MTRRLRAAFLNFPSRFLTSRSIAISDDEMSDVGITSDVLPKKTRKLYKEPDIDEFDDDEDEAADPKPAVANADEDDEDDEDLDEDEFVVEKIFSHYIADDVLFSI